MKRFDEPILPIDNYADFIPKFITSIENLIKPENTFYNKVNK